MNFVIVESSFLQLPFHCVRLKLNLVFLRLPNLHRQTVSLLAFLLLVYVQSESGFCVGLFIVAWFLHVVSI